MFQGRCCTLCTWKNVFSDPRVDRLKVGQVIFIFIPFGALKIFTVQFLFVQSLTDIRSFT